ncbi:hypothetical protein [Escherichia coli]|nr:hypothetical protein [Escherichia coli]
MKKRYSKQGALAGTISRASGMRIIHTLKDVELFFTGDKRRK